MRWAELLSNFTPNGPGWWGHILAHEAITTNGAADGLWYLDLEAPLRGLI